MYVYNVKMGSITSRAMFVQNILLEITETDPACVCVLRKKKN